MVSIFYVTLRKTLNPFQSCEVFHVEPSYLLCSLNQMTSFCMECNTGLKWVKDTLIQMSKLVGKTVSWILCIFNPYSFGVIYPWNLPSFFETVCFLTGSIVLTSVWKICRSFTGLNPINKYLIKDKFILRGIKLWNFIFDKGLLQLIGEKKSLIHNNNLTGHKKVQVAYGFWSSWRNESSLCFSI